MTYDLALKITDADVKRILKPHHPKTRCFDFVICGRENDAVHERFINGQSAGHWCNTCWQKSSYKKEVV